jgi:hypothetical protein
MRLIMLTLAASLAIAGCSDDDSAPVNRSHALEVAKAAGYPMAGDTTEGAAHDLLDVLEADGIPSGSLAPADNMITSMGGGSWNVDVADDGIDDGINLFPTTEALDDWAELSQSVNGIAVVGDTWAISLESQDPGRSASEDLAPQIAEALGADVVD